MPRDSIGSIDASFMSADNSMQAYGQEFAKPLMFLQATTMTKPTTTMGHSNTRLLSSVDESGPVHKKARGVKTESNVSLNKQYLIELMNNSLNVQCSEPENPNVRERLGGIRRIE
ncbi:hypothetical protein M422DRAFT_265780 [Sphaerobolus stellatus SS14]|uniref:Uncharacterized protein n=1 Tax=Sphaerobolus stellatus (strain SS14) TaxID=990650 RepID=A0A0C9V4S0_SPHS4|nr:hypothetical protein M422DRAFT_265780 [Sphaerobolus stellatus SS14]